MPQWAEFLFVVMLLAIIVLYILWDDANRKLAEYEEKEQKRLSKSP